MMFKTSKDDSPRSDNATTAARRSHGEDAPSIIGASVTLTGNLDSKGEIQLDGKIVGDVTCSTLSLGESGSIKGIISAETVIIRGAVEGEICGKSVRLDKSAQVTGDIYHTTLSIEAGATVSGHFLHRDNPLEASRESKSAERSSEASAPTPPRRHDPLQPTPPQQQRQRMSGDPDIRSSKAG